jgi:hypothetical protein
MIGEYCVPSIICPTLSLYFHCWYHTYINK